MAPRATPRRSLSSKAPAPPASAAASSPRALVIFTAAAAIFFIAASGLRAVDTRGGELDPAEVLAMSRRATLEARWAQRRAHADAELRLAKEERQLAPANDSADGFGAAEASERERDEAAGFSLGQELQDVVQTQAAPSSDTGCNVPPRPYHTLLTSSSGGYQAWQCRLMYHHWKLQKARDPCGEMGGFTRLLTTHNEQPDSLADEIPTVVVKEKTSGGYVVVNRPSSMVQFIKHPKFKERITEAYVYIAETDHLLLRPLPNLATPTVPAGFDFGYMVAWGQAKIVDKFVPGMGGKTDPVGPSPVIIHVEQLLKVVPQWHDFTLRIMADAEAVQHLGWVREMWGYCIAAANLGIKHRVLDAFQFEGGSIGNRERRLAWPNPAAPVTPDQPMPYYIFHYTYGVEYGAEGLPVELQVGEWSLDKRHYMGGGPPLDLHAPPQCAHDRAWVLRALWNNGTAALAARGKWSGGGGNTERFNSFAYRGHPLRSSAAAARLLGTGPWSLLGRGGKPFRIDKLYLMSNGWLVSRKGHGRWGLRKQGGAWDDATIVISVCGVSDLALRPTFGAEGWTLSNADGNAGEVQGTLAAPAAALRAWNAPLATELDALSQRIEGSGAYRGAAWRGELFFLRAGVLVAEGSPSLPYPLAADRYKALTRWVALDATRVALGSAQDDAAALRSYARGVHVAFLDCYALRFVRPPLDLLPSGAPLPAPPAQYALKSEAESLEWIIKPKTLPTACVDACGGMTLRQLTADDRAASALARAVEGCCGWSWHGHPGLDFKTGGALVTPWGHGVWGAPPEGQAGGAPPALLAEFAGQQHLLRATLNANGELTGMRSSRCHDNDQASVTLTRGKPPKVR